MQIARASHPRVHADRDPAFPFRASDYRISCGRSDGGSATATFDVLLAISPGQHPPSTSRDSSTGDARPTRSRYNDAAVLVQAQPSHTPHRWSQQPSHYQLSVAMMSAEHAHNGRAEVRRFRRIARRFSLRFYLGLLRATSDDERFPGEGEGPPLSIFSSLLLSKMRKLEEERVMLSEALTMSRIDRPSQVSPGISKSLRDAIARRSPHEKALLSSPDVLGTDSSGIAALRYDRRFSRI